MGKRHRRRRLRISGFWLTIIAALCFRVFAAEAYVIPSESMLPTLKIGDRVFVNKTAFGLRIPQTDKWLVRYSAPQSGDIVVLLNPENIHDTPLIKRVIGLAGDRIAMRDNQVLLNGKPVAENHLAQSCKGERGQSCSYFNVRLAQHAFRVQHDHDQAPFAFAERRIPAEHCFVMGDNRDNSHDSRFFGVVPYTHLVGRAARIFWSYQPGKGMRWQRIGQALP